MTTIATATTTTPASPAPSTGASGVAPPPRPSWRGALTTLARRRLALSARTPRELLIPLINPLLFALVVVPALADTLGGDVGGIDYMTYAAVSAAGLLIPLSCLTAGLGVVVDRLGGSQRDLLAAPVPRSLVVAGNLVVALLLSTLQLAVLMGAAALRGAEFDLRATGVMWFVAAAVAFAVAMYAVAETIANRAPTQEDYIGALPPVAILPYFLAGSLFPISALPAGLEVIAKAMPLTHVLALLRYGIVDPSGAGLHDIWGMDDTTAMAALSLGVVAVFTVAMTVVATRTFRRAVES
ncbi:MAG TPA: ABC transporter permease [Acidimicrobiales bacterium]